MKVYAWGLLALAAFVGSAVGADAPSCDSAKQCDALGGKAYRAKDYARAAALYEQQVGWVEQASRDCEAAQEDHPDRKCADVGADAYNNAALAWLRAGAPLKAKAWLSVTPAAPSTTHNKGLVDATLASFKAPSSPVGEYWQYAGFGSWSTVSVTPNGKQFDVQFSGLHFSANGMKYGPNMGDLSATVSIADRHGVMRGDKDSPTCKVDMKFSDFGLDMDADGDCGFGAGVGAMGHFDRVSVKPE